MSNPFTRSRQSNAAPQQPAPIPMQGGGRTPPPTAYSGASNVFHPTQYAFPPGSLGGRPVPPPPSVDAVSQQLSSMSLNSEPPQSSPSALPSGRSSSGDYLAIRGHYKVPSVAYNIGAADPAQSQQQSLYNSETGAFGSSVTPAYIGQTASLSASAPPPPAFDSSMQPDEEYVKLSCEIAPNSASLQGLAGIPFGAVFRPMSPDGVAALQGLNSRATSPWSRSDASACSAASAVARTSTRSCSSSTADVAGAATCADTSTMVRLVSPLLSSA